LSSTVSSFVSCGEKPAPGKKQEKRINLENKRECRKGGIRKTKKKGYKGRKTSRRRRKKKKEGQGNIRKGKKSRRRGRARKETQCAKKKVPTKKERFSGTIPI